MGKRRKRPAPKRPEESKAADAVTVGWMLTTLATLGAELLALATSWLVQGADAQRMGAPLRSLPAILLFIALISGLCSLLLMLPVVRMRQVQPPLTVLVTAALICTAPLVILLVMAVR